MSQSGESKYGEDTDLRELNKHLKSLYFNILRQLKIGENTDELIDQIREFEQYAEALIELPTVLNLVSAEGIMEKAQDRPSREVNGHTGSARRQKNSSYDFLLLEAFRWREAFGPIGHSNLLNLALEFDHNTKKTSLVAKLNRWKNDKGWLEWSQSEDITMTQSGEAERARLFPLVKRDGDLDAVRDAFSEAWSITVNLS